MMVERNVDTPEARRVVYRIGVHLGDVLIDGDDILGEGVNVAALLAMTDVATPRLSPAPPMIRSAENLLSVFEPSVCKN